MQKCIGVSIKRSLSGVNLTEAFDRKKNRNLIHHRRSESQQQRPSRHQSSREDDPIFKCMRCGSQDVNQAQNPYHWPGNELCGLCKSDTAHDTLKIESFQNERTVSMKQAEEEVDESTKNTQASKKGQVLLFSKSRATAKKRYESQNRRMKPLYAAARAAQDKLDEERKARGKEWEQEGRR